MMQAPRAFRSMSRPFALSLASGGWLIIALACRTTAGSGTSQELIENPVYDGSAESMDSLPDCGAELLGSLFWVREVNTGFECAADGKWIIKSYKDPDGNSHSPPTP